MAVSERQLMSWGALVNRHRSFLVLVLTFALMVGVGCTAGDIPLSENVVEAPTGNGAALPPSDGEITPDGEETTPPEDGETVPTEQASLLACEAQPYAVETGLIGGDGGQLMVGDHKLTILPGALSADVQIVMEQIEGTVNSVRLSPEGLHFAIPAILSLSYKNCPPVWHSKRIVYTDESLTILEVMRSLDFNRASQVKGLIDHFSRYAVSY